MHVLHRLGAVTAATVLTTAAAPGGAASQQLVLADILERAADYMVEYAPKVSGVVLDEQYVLKEIGARGMLTPQRIGSHVTFVDLFGKVIALRDVFSIDGAATRPRTSRISELLAKPTPEKWQLAQRYAEEGQIYFLRDLVIRVSEPTIALQYLSGANQPKFKWRLEGRRTLNGAAVVTLRFDEPQSRDAFYFLKTSGNSFSSGRIYLDAASGTVHKTELWLESTSESARLETVFAPDPTLGMWLPRQTTENYELREPGGTAVGGGQLTLRHTIEGNAVYSNPRHSPIDLTKMVR